MLVLDYSAGKPGAAAIKREGYAGAVRYIGFPARRKCTDAAELADFTKHGLGMALVYEDHAEDWLGGRARGVEAGARARAHANQIGFPSDRPIYMAVDRDVVTSGEFGVMVEYLRGAAKSLGGVDRTGVYGEFDVCVRAQQAGVARWFWQCRAWSGTPARLFAGRHLYQRVGIVEVGGVGCDINDVLQADWGQHTREDDVSYDEAKRAIRDYFEQPIVNPREDNTDGRTTNLRTQLLFSDWRQVRLVGAFKDIVAPLLDDEAKAAAAFAKLDQAVANLGEPITPEEHARALAETLPAAVLTALRDLIKEDA